VAFKRSAVGGDEIAEHHVAECPNYNLCFNAYDKASRLSRLLVNIMEQRARLMAVLPMKFPLLNTFTTVA